MSPNQNLWQTDPTLFPEFKEIFFLPDFLLGKIIWLWKKITNFWNRKKEKFPIFWINYLAASWRSISCLRTAWVDLLIFFYIYSLNPDSLHIRRWLFRCFADWLCWCNSPLSKTVLPRASFSLPASAWIFLSLWCFWLSWLDWLDWSSERFGWENAHGLYLLRFREKRCHILLGFLDRWS